jgi:hypothetical protein
MTNLSLAQLRHAVSIKERIDGLQVELSLLLDKPAPLAPAASVSASADGRRGRKRSPAVRARMAAAQRARWAKKSKGPVAAPKPAPSAPAKKRKRHFSPEARARISAAAKARWAKAKSSGKRRLG